MERPRSVNVTVSIPIDVLRRNVIPYLEKHEIIERTSGKVKQLHLKSKGLSYVLTRLIDRDKNNNGPSENLSREWIFTGHDHATTEV